jgi:tight adherence protein B
MQLERVLEKYPADESVKRSLTLAKHFGARPAEVLDRLAAVVADRDRARAELALAKAGPKSSARVVLLLPVGVLGFAQLAGLKVLVNPTAISLASMFFGGLLLLLGRFWSNRIVVAAEPSAEDPGEAIDAFASGLAVGLPPRVVADAVTQMFGISPEIEVLIADSASEGLAIADLALARADQMRLAKRVSDETRIREAGVRLMWPLGLAVLPAFVLIAVIPLAAALLT